VFDHILFEVTDLDRSAAFYDAIALPLGLRRMWQEGDVAIAYGRDDARLWIVARDHPPGPSYGHTALQATGRAAVDAAYAAGLKAGGRDDGPPGPRPQYGPLYYAGFLLDPDGYRVEVVCGSH